jgi:GNAT superfamily N-acetyltransferase
VIAFSGNLDRMVTSDPGVTFVQITAEDAVHADLHDSLIECWMAVSNAGGAAGFPFPPVDVSDIAPVADALIRDLDPKRSRLIVALDDGVLAGWVNLHRDLNPVVSHWGTVRHLQTHPQFRRRGIGVALMRRLHAVARAEMGLSQLHLAARAGMGLEEFYGQLGWREIGRWHGALRLADGDDRDEVLMILDPL